jgi:hypothetical protein
VKQKLTTHGNSLASFIHHIFILSPEGQYLLKLLENVHRLAPYLMIKQTLRVGNAATMVNGMMRLLLAKVGVGALSNWLGFTQNADDGMNLLQRIISLVLSWDSSEFRKTADRIEKASGGPSKEHLSVIRDYVELSQAEHEALRELSRVKPESVVAAIFENTQPELLESLSETQHAQCLEYYSAILSIRDREQITKVLCRSNPDLFTQALRDLVASFEPMIRTIHGHIDLREHIGAMETFLDDFISTSKMRNDSAGGKKSIATPTVEDYVALFRRNRKLLYNWLHQFAANCPDVRESFREWAKKTMLAFREKHASDVPDIPTRSSSDPDGISLERSRPSAAGDMSRPLQQLFRNLTPSTQAEVVSALDAHAAYLSDLEDLSIRRMQRVLDNLAERASQVEGLPSATPIRPPISIAGVRSFWPSASSSARTTPVASGANTPARGPGSMSGPGMFLARWQALLDRTVVTPSQASGSPARTGRDVKGATSQGKVGIGEGNGSVSWNAAAFLARQADSEVPVPPEVGVVVDAMGPAFAILAGELAKATVPADTVQAVDITTG